ncbi:MAG TPA: sigma-E factor regulatory protein RseB domain-containing protein [Thermodesulfobacteriota bacterium]|nr:sigma-E factor regulatory protein RseB domain-containing protein [Thermodesulfobacteriota bacterium]
MRPIPVTHQTNSTKNVPASGAAPAATGLAILLMVVFLIAPEAVISQDIDQLLSRMQSANSRTTYQGTLTTVIVNTPCPIIYQYKIINYGNHLRHEEALTQGIQKEISYDDGQYLWRFFPHKRLLLKERSCKTDLGVPNAQETLQLVRDNYSINVAGIFSIKGRSGYRLRFRPRTDDRPQQVFWIDEATGIPFKIEKYGPDNHLVSVSSFSDLQFGTFQPQQPFLKVPPQTFVAEVSEQSNLTLNKAHGLMGASILVPRYLPPGFVRKNICIRNQGTKKVLQFFYTDGLSSLSLFQTPTATTAPATSSHLPTKKTDITSMPNSGFFRASGTLNTLTVTTEPMTSTVMGEIFKNQMTKVAQSLAPSPFSTPHQNPSAPSPLTTIPLENHQ